MHEVCAKGMFWFWRLPSFLSCKNTKTYQPTCALVALVFVLRDYLLELKFRVPRNSTDMFGRRAADLIRSLDRAADESIPPYNAEAVRGICEEITAINDSNFEDSSKIPAGNSAAGTRDESLGNTISFRHFARERNVRCLVAYHYNRMERLRNLRWSYGGIIPRDIRAALSEKEIEWFNGYNALLAEYMEDNGGLNLTMHQKPPQELYIHVRVLKEYGNYEMEDGEVVLLKQHTRHVLPRNECEDLIRQGILEHVAS